jgi:formamidase
MGSDTLTTSTVLDRKEGGEVTPTLGIVGAQIAPAPWNVEATLNDYEGYVRHSMRSLSGVRLIVHPELYLSALGPFDQEPPPHWSQEAVAEPVPGPLTERLCELARELDVWLVPGSIFERGEQGRIHNTALAISPAGTIAARHRKVFPWRPYELTEPGEEFTTFELDDVTVGLMICYDGWFPEVARQLAWLGAEVLIHPAATGTADRPQELVLARATAITNQAFVVNLNTGEPAGRGRSLIVDPEGGTVVEADGTAQTLTATIDPDRVEAVRSRGTLGLNRLWEQFSEHAPGISWPAYGGRVRTPA